jgi:hypothetical protein
MSKPPGIQAPIPYQPHLAIRLACWFGIYFAASSLYMSGLGIKPVPGSHAINLFWFAVQDLPSGLQLLILGSLHLPFGGSYDYFTHIFAYGCYLLNLVLSLAFPSRRIFWSLIVLLIVLIGLSYYGSSCYVSDVFETIPSPQTH